MTEQNEVAVSGPPFVFSKENLDVARGHIGKYPAGREASAVLPLLHLAQRQNGGFLTLQALDYVADFLHMPHMRVYEVATFYSMFKLQPMGRHHVEVCTNVPCWLRGSSDILAACRNKLGIEVGETTADGAFTLSEAECLGACVNAPMAQIGDDYYEDLTPESTTAILEALARGEKPKAGSQIGRRGAEPVGGLTSLTTMPGAPTGPDSQSGEA
ncbi:MAG: NADH-quinone oxidoreductase subunit NuoE [Rhodospirillales bacterium]|nr:NADH-quinone oxidoreductase subunit NuoE [Rhodospirillales bacterium]